MLPSSDRNGRLHAREAWLPRLWMPDGLRRTLDLLDTMRLDTRQAAQVVVWLATGFAFFGFGLLALRDPIVSIPSGWPAWTVRVVAALSMTLVPAATFTFARTRGFAPGRAALAVLLVLVLLTGRAEWLGFRGELDGHFHGTLERGLLSEGVALLLFLWAGALWPAVLRGERRTFVGGALLTLGITNHTAGGAAMGLLFAIDALVLTLRGEGQVWSRPALRRGLATCAWFLVLIAFWIVPRMADRGLTSIVPSDFHWHILSFYLVATATVLAGAFRGRTLRILSGTVAGVLLLALYSASPPRIPGDTPQEVPMAEIQSPGEIVPEQPDDLDAPARPLDRFAGVVSLVGFLLGGALGLIPRARNSRLSHARKRPRRDAEAPWQPGGKSAERDGWPEPTEDPARMQRARELRTLRSGRGREARPKRGAVLRALGGVSIVIPSFNEERRLPGSLFRILSYLDEVGGPFEIVIVDDGSDDETSTRSREMLRTRRARVVTLPRNRGKGYAVREGIRAAELPWVLVTDSDLSTPIDEAETLARVLREREADVAIGSRYVAGAQVDVRQPLLRRSVDGLFRVFVRMLTGLPYRDTQCGFKLMRRSAVLPLLDSLRVDRFAWDVEFLLRARNRGLFVAEVPVFWRDDRPSRVRLLRDPLLMLRDLLATRLRAGRSTAPRLPEIYLLPLDEALSEEEEEEDEERPAA